jgi:glycosyl transferase family 4
VTRHLHCLWVTRLIPYAPYYGGDAIYSARLIDVVARAGASVTVLTHENGARPETNPDVTWVAVPLENRHAWQSILRTAPSIVHRYSTPRLLMRLRELLEAQSWDVVIVDNIAMARAADVVTRQFRGATRPRLVYLSHNHEASLRTAAARSYEGNPVARGAALFDAWKVRRIESRLVHLVDLITANTPADETEFRREFPRLSTIVITPGYDGPVDADRPISSATPRRAVILGSFGWLAKQRNLLAFLDAAALPFASASIEIAVVGAMPDEFETSIRSKFPLVAIHRSVLDVRPYLATARIGLVPEEIGGGFKHKVLHYVFNGLPVMNLKGSVAGLPLLAGSSILEFPTYKALVNGVVSTIDDFDRLNNMRIAATAACIGRFDWRDRGVALYAELERSIERRTNVPAIEATSRVEP